MTRARLLGLTAAALMCGATVPAMAAWDRIGSVDLSRFDRQATQWIGNRGRIDRVDLMARGNDVMCRNVTATFRNGRTRDVFHGFLREGQRISVDLPGQERNVQRLDFNCRPVGGRSARVNIAANFDYGYRDRYRPFGFRG